MILIKVVMVNILTTCPKDLINYFHDNVKAKLKWPWFIYRRRGNTNYLHSLQIRFGSVIGNPNYFGGERDITLKKLKNHFLQNSSNYVIVITMQCNSLIFYILSSV